MAWKQAKAREPLDPAQLYDYALRALGRRMRTEKELSRLLLTRVEKGESGQERVAGVLNRLREQRLLDDEAYAADYTRLRQEGAKFGRRRVQQDLQTRGVASELISTTLDQAYAETDELALACAYLERKRAKPPADEKASARLVRALLRGGFSLPTAYKALRQFGAGEAALPEGEPEPDPEQP